MPEPPARKAALERWLEAALFQSRWLMAPFYLGLVLALAALLVVFIKEVIHELAHVMTMTADEAVVLSLSLIDMSLAGNLLLIVIFAGYENFVSKIDTGDSEDRPSWMGTVDYSGLKMKLIASLVAITAVALLRALLRRASGQGIGDSELAWLVGIHLTFVVSGVLLALMDLLASKAEKH